ncbi:Hydroxyindole-O-methyltransferase [Handroanthus impetiginosus]|uniref:Hydroxyindole-O-methyltransferase n=1 Tax=Handroanthus impetiginosus TaxID=429701 RepID=A0A2G9GTK1_9LAMI|nr:Hydroxyindole-O-methyltransferase [Handroanthus impetiginosus]
MPLPSGIESTQELVEAQAHVWNHIFSFINSMSLKCTIQLRIPDIIYQHGKPMTLIELTDALYVNKAKSLCIERLMSIMIHSKFFIKIKISEEDEQEGYWLTPVSRLLLRDEPVSLTPFALAALDPILTDPWHDVSKWFHDDHSTPFVTTHGKTLWEHAGQDPRMNQIFNEGMASDARLVTSVIIKNCGHVFQGLKSMVDVAGGTGTVAKAIADEFPDLKCSVLDLPNVVSGLEGTKNLTFVGGDMFESIPSADAIFMKWILHDWPDEECIKILGKCKEALIPSKDNGGKVIIVDMVVNNQKGHEAFETQLFFDMLMMILTSGRERTEKDWAELFIAAGFTSYKITPIIGLRSLIEIFP